MLCCNSWGWDDMGNSEWINKRGARQLDAARAVEQHHGRIMGILAECLEDLAPELEGIGQFQQDLVLAGEVSYRLDKMINLGDPIAEALDGVVIWFRCTCSHRGMESHRATAQAERQAAGYPTGCPWRLMVSDGRQHTATGLSAGYQDCAGSWRGAQSSPLETAEPCRTWCPQR